MTREEELDWLCRLRSEIYVFMPIEWLIPMNDALDMAIKTLEQKPCDDAISRQAVLIAIKNLYPDKPIVDIMGARQKWFEKHKPYFECEKVVEQLPSVTPQPKMGRWLHREIMDYLDKNEVIHNHFMCQDCGFIHDFIDGHTAQYKYCPSCGAKMQEVEE